MLMKNVLQDYVSHYLMEVRITKKMKIGLLDSIDYFKVILLIQKESNAIVRRS